MATEAFAKVEHDYGNGFGSIPQYAVKIDGLVGLSSAASATIANYIESPFGEDMIIIDAYMCITTVDATGSADFDIGIGDDAAMTNAEDTIFNAPSYDTATVLKGLVVSGVAGVARPIWKKKGATTNSFICCQQNGNVDASSLVYNLILIVAPYAKFQAT